MKNAIDKYVEWAESKRLCEQCVRPWLDGICTCGRAAEFEEKQNKVIELASELEREDWNKRLSILDKQRNKRIRSAKKIYKNPEWRRQLQEIVSDNILHRLQIEDMERSDELD